MKWKLKSLSEEGLEDPSKTVQQLLEILSKKINESLEYLKAVDPASLAEQRGVGRKKLPSTVLGLLFHAAEHTLRHTGQLLVTARILMHQED